MVVEVRVAPRATTIVTSRGAPLQVHEFSPHDARLKQFYKKETRLQ